MKTKFARILLVWVLLVGSMVTSSAKEHSIVIKGEQLGEVELYQDSLSQALEIVARWWEERKAGFGDFVFRAPGTDWRVFEVYKDGILTHVSLRETCAPGQTVDSGWSGDVIQGRLHRWELALINAPDYSIIWHVTLGEGDEPSRVMRVEIIHPTIDWVGA